MLTISQAQLAKMDDMMSEQFVARLVQFVRRECTSKDAFRPELVPNDDAELERLVRERVAIGRTYGMTYESSLAAFAVLSFSYATNFDEIPQVKNILTNSDEDPNERIGRVFALLNSAELERERSAKAAIRD